MVSSLTNMIGPLIERANGALDSLAAASGSLDRVLRGVDENSLKVTLSHLQKTLDNTRRLTGTLADHSEDFDALIANLKETSVRLNTVLVKADTAMTGIQTAAGETSLVPTAALLIANQIGQSGQPKIRILLS